jgi:hypothetical protein
LRGYWRGLLSPLAFGDFLRLAASAEDQRCQRAGVGDTCGKLVVLQDLLVLFQNYSRMLQPDDANHCERRTLSIAINVLIHGAGLRHGLKTY